MPTKIIRKRVNKKKGEKGWYSEAQRMEAFTLYLTLGNMEEVGRRLDIGVKTLYSWKYSDWWKLKYKELEQGNRIKVSAKVSNIIDKSTDKLLDMVENGPLFYNKATKQLERRPASPREVTEILKAASIVQEQNDKAVQVFENLNNREAQAKELTDRLERIAGALLSGKPPRQDPPAVIDVTPIKENDL